MSELRAESTEVGLSRPRHAGGSRGSGGSRNFHVGGADYIPGVWGGSFPVGVQGEAPITKSPRAKAVCSHCLLILTAETMKI